MILEVFRLQPKFLTHFCYRRMRSLSSSYTIFKCSNDNKLKDDVDLYGDWSDESESPPCDKNIIFTNEQQLKQKINYKGQAIHHYKAYNGTIRIFCHQCAYKCIVCEIDGCNQGDVLKICQEHPKCAFCNKHYYDPENFFKTRCKKKCNTVYCRECIPWSIDSSHQFGNKKCHICSTKLQTYSIKKALSKLNILQNNYKLAQCIAQFSTGYVVNCCNKECMKEIFIDDVFTLYLNAMGSNSGNFYAYICKYMDSKLEPVYNINGKKYRIFCKECCDTMNSFGWNPNPHSLLHRCNFCQKFDTVMAKIARKKNPNAYYYGDEYLTEYLCTQHPICNICNGRSGLKLNKCYYCKNKYCKTCGNTDLSLCKNCIILEEYQWIFDGLLRTVNDIETIVIGTDVIGIITEYAMGYAVKCCVWDCNDEVSIENRWDLWDNLQSNEIKERKYSWYEITKKQLEDGVYDIYDMKIRIFCKYCTENVLLNCKQSWCDNMDAGIICKQHLYCIQCGKRDYISGACYPMGYQRLNVEECSICNKLGKAYCTDCHVKHCKYDQVHRRKQLSITLRNFAEIYDDQYIFNKTCQPYRLFGMQ